MSRARNLHKNVGIIPIDTTTTSSKTTNLPESSGDYENSGFDVSDDHSGNGNLGIEVNVVPEDEIQDSDKLIIDVDSLGKTLTKIILDVYDNVNEEKEQKKQMVSIIIVYLFTFYNIYQFR